MKDWNKLFAWIFLSTGVFAIVGAVFTWGEGWLFVQPSSSVTLLPWADLMVTAPISLLSAYGIWHTKRWGMVVGLLTCGIYLYGSVLVYVQVFRHDLPCTPQLIIPPVFGLASVCGYLVWILKYSGGLER